MDNMSRNAKIVAGVASAIVGTACLVGLVSQFTSAQKEASTSKKSKKKRGGKKKKAKSPEANGKSKGGPSTREMAIKIEKLCLQAFKEFLPTLGGKEMKMMEAAQKQGRLTAEVGEQIRAAMADDATAHLDKIKAKLCQQFGCSEKNHDDMIGELLEKNDPEVKQLEEESIKLWGVFKPRSTEVPEHMTEEKAIAYIKKSFKMVIEATKHVRKQFFEDSESQEAIAQFKERMRADEALQQQFYAQFQQEVASRKAALMKEYQIDNPDIAASLIEQYQTRKQFVAEVQKAKKELDDFFLNG